MRIGAVCGFLAATLFLMPTLIFGQSKRSKSDKNIDLVGHRNIDRELNNYSLDDEKRIGKRMAEQAAKSYKFVTDPGVIGYLERVDQKLEQNSDKHIPMTLHVIDSDDVARPLTAMAGQLFVTRGLLFHMDNEGELASLLARAIAVTALRSQTTLATQAQQIVITDALSDPGFSPSEGPVITMPPPMATLHTTPGSVFDADYFGIQYVYKSGYDPSCFLQYVQQVGETSKTFPPIPKRLKELQKEIAEILPKRDENIVTTPEFQQFKSRLQALAPQGVASRPPGSKR